MFRHSLNQASLFAIVCLALGMIGCSAGANDPVPVPPALVAPLDQGRNIQTSLELQWNISEDADTYDLQVSEDASFSSLMVDLKGMPRNFFVLTGLDIGTSYHWRVRASNDVGDSEWSPAWRFTPELDATPPPTPALAIPADSTKNLAETINFSWDPVEGATHYHLQVALEPTYIRKVANVELLRENTMTVRQLIPTYIYFWRVRAVNPEGSSSWSETRILAVGNTIDWVPIFDALGE